MPFFNELVGIEHKDDTFFIGPCMYPYKPLKIEPVFDKVRKDIERKYLGIRPF